MIGLFPPSSRETGCPQETTNLRLHDLTRKENMKGTTEKKMIFYHFFCTHVP